MRVVCFVLSALLLSTLALASTETGAMTEAQAAELYQKEAEADHASLLEEVRQMHPVRQSARAVPTMDSALLDRANLLFRALDANHDQRITAEDVQASAQKLGDHLPGISADDFSAFISVADRNGDNSLSSDEFVAGLEQGLQGAGSLLETDATARRVGFLKGVFNHVKNTVGKIGRMITGKVDSSNDGCVMCQYIIERAEANVKQSGVIPAVTGAQQGPTIFLETESQSLVKQSPFEMAAANVIGATRLATRYQRQLERQKYNEIYRVVDITLDDVCEQGMPTSFYGFCKQIYQAQSDVVDGLRYQYRPADICYRIGACAKDSYITQGIHSRYQ